MSSFALIQPPMILQHLRVIEVGGGISASYAGKLLADAGADVIKIEPPGGDPLRRVVGLRRRTG